MCEVQCKLTSVDICPRHKKKILSNKAGTQEGSSEKTPNLGLGAIYKNEIRPLVKTRKYDGLEKIE